MKNGCFDKPRPIAETTYLAQSGWGPTYDNGHGPWRMPRYVEVKHVLSTDCQYTKTTPDPRCAGCVHERKGETGS